MATTEDSQQVDEADALLLTDDEVVALAAERSTFWPAPLPTLRTDDAAELSRASFRGHRSLIVRALAGDDGSLRSARLELVSSLPGRDALIGVFLGDDRFRRAGWGLLSNHYPDTPEWILETVTPLGIHRFIRQPLANHLTYIQALLSGALHEGPMRSATDAEQPSWLCVLSAGAGGTTLAAARRGEVRVGAVTFDAGVIGVPVALNATDPHAAVAALASVHIRDGVD